MNIFLKILKEIGIGLVIAAILLGVTYFTFKEQIPLGKEIPKGNEYVQVNKKEYSVSSSNRLEGIEAVTITHETNSNQIVDAENEVRIQTGKYTPFGAISSDSDLPTEKVGISASVSGDASVQNNNTNSNNQNGDLKYPVTDDAIKQIEKDQSESAESAANRRFDNEE